MKQSVGVALIGCGKQARKHVAGLRAAGARIIVADTDPSAARWLGETEDLPWSADVPSLLGRADIDAVDICTPTPTHPDLIYTALEAGMHFFCEKPLATGVADARGILEKARQSGLLGMVGYVYRFVPVLQLARDLVRGPTDQAVLGEPIRAHFRIGGRGSHRLWKHMRATGGGAINEMLVHMLDLALWYFGDLGARLLDCRQLLGTREIGGHLVDVDAEDYVLVEMTNASGLNVLCHADMLTPAFTQYVEIQGTNGTFFGSIQEELPSFVYLKSARDGYSAGRTELQCPRRDLFHDQMCAFVASVARGTVGLGCDIEGAVKVAEAVDSIRAQVTM